MIWRCTLFRNAGLHLFPYQYEYIPRKDNRRLKTSCFSADVDRTVYRQQRDKPNRECLSDYDVLHSADTILPNMLRIKLGLEIRDETLFVSLKSDVVLPYNIYAQSCVPVFPESSVWAFATKYHRYKHRRFSPMHPGRFASLLLSAPIVLPILAQ